MICWWFAKHPMSETSSADRKGRIFKYTVFLLPLQKGSLITSFLKFYTSKSSDIILVTKHIVTNIILCDGYLLHPNLK